MSATLHRFLPCSSCCCRLCVGPPPPLLVLRLTNWQRRSPNLLCSYQGEAIECENLNGTYLLSLVYCTYGISGGIKFWDASYEAAHSGRTICGYSIRPTLDFRRWEPGGWGRFGIVYPAPGTSFGFVWHTWQPGVTDPFQCQWQQDPGDPLPPWDECHVGDATLSLP